MVVSADTAECLALFQTPVELTCMIALTTFASWHDYLLKKSFPFVIINFFKERPWLFSQGFQSSTQNHVIVNIHKAKQSKTALSHQDKIKLCLILFEELGMKYYILEIFSSLILKIKAFLLKEVNTKLLIPIFRATPKPGSVPELKFYYLLDLILFLV